MESLPPEAREQFAKNGYKEVPAREGVEREDGVLHELWRHMRLRKYGPAGEQLNDEQLELLEQEPGVSQFEVEAETERGESREAK
ncbi:MAG: hypothetical protein JO279_16485 [Verrucomicrobia bacterium]|nr:hypothetical protein [Verrucomicrobiota bacterium]MBV8378595.1 hypothetical protein [Verrucomicrobiota bacterium]